jgi:hypothetical protein
VQLAHTLIIPTARHSSFHQNLILHADEAFDSEVDIA